MLRWRWMVFCLLRGKSAVRKKDENKDGRMGKAVLNWHDKIADTWKPR
jgi:hypothetical protein